MFLIGTPCAPLTGTEDRDPCSVINSKLSLKDLLIIHISPNRENLLFTILSVKKDAIFGELNWLVEHPKEKGEKAYQAIVFCYTMNDIACVVNYFTLKLGKHAYLPSDSCNQPNRLIGIYPSN